MLSMQLLSMNTYFECYIWFSFFAEEDVLDKCWQVGFSASDVSNSKDWSDVQWANSISINSSDGIWNENLSWFAHGKGSFSSKIAKIYLLLEDPFKRHCHVKNITLNFFDFLACLLIAVTQVWQKIRLVFCVQCS